jgi:hypothetical protein
MLCNHFIPTQYTPTILATILATSPTSTLCSTSPSYLSANQQIFTNHNSNLTVNMKHAPILALLTLVSQALGDCDCGYRYFLIFTFVCSPAQRPQHQSD